MTTLVLSLVVELVVLLAMSVVLSSYERRCMSLLHNRDAPIAYLLAGLGQPVADGGKLLMKTTVAESMTTSRHTSDGLQVLSHRLTVILMVYMLVVMLPQH